MKTMPPIILTGAVWVTFMSVIGTACTVLVAGAVIWLGLTWAAGWIHEFTGEREIV